MRSLRGRLVAILLLVAFGGMVVLAAVTFTEQRAYLYDRLDRQVQNGLVAAVPVLVAAQESGSGSCQGFSPDDAPFGHESRESRDNDAPGGPGGFSLPPGTYAAFVDASGQVAASCIFGYEHSSTASEPDFANVGLSREPRTVSSTGTSDTKYRIAARAAATGEKLVVAVPMGETSQTVNRLRIVETIVILSVLAILGVIAWLLVGVGLRPLDRMGETADAIAGGDLSRRVEHADEHSEIGRLGGALNRMLHSLEQAFNEREASEGRLRQFLADASHELRTPLVSIRGYSELYRLGATPDDEEVERSMERIEQEAERMGVLVEDMLTLARLDETHEHNLADVDLSVTAADAVSDAEVAAPDREFSLTTDGPHVVIGDSHQLHQVLTNLLRNAIVHTPDGSPIEVSVARSGDDVRLDVRDHGPGLPAGAAEHIFERFWRSEAGRGRGKAGSGLGLSIVAGIVEAHGGRVHATNAGGGGAVFSVWLPVPGSPNDLSQLPD